MIFDRRRCPAVLAAADDLAYGSEVRELREFFDGVRPDDKHPTDGGQRRRWDRLVALHLLVLAFIAKCGYAWDSTDFRARVDQAARMLLYPGNLSAQSSGWLPRLGLVEQAQITYIP